MTSGEKRGNSLNTYMNRLLIILGLVFGVTVQAQVPQPAPKPDKPKKERPEKGDKKWDPAKAKERVKAAFDKRKKGRADAKKRGHKVRNHKKGSAFGKLVRDDAKIKELKEAFAAAAKKGHKGFDRKAWKDATDEEKKALREKLAAGRKEWYETMKAHRVEVGKRIKEIREEFKNNRDAQLDVEEPTP